MSNWFSYSRGILGTTISFSILMKCGIVMWPCLAWRDICALWREQLSSAARFSPNAVITVLLTEREGRTGEYWPEVVAVRTSLRSVRTKTTDGQYSTVRLEQARLVTSLLPTTRQHYRAVRK